MKLRPYQEEPVRKAVEFFRQDSPEPALMVLPTAWGKSLLAAECAAACPDPILVVQPTKELLEQNLEKYRLLCGSLAPAGVYSASFGKKEIEHVTFATIGSIKNIGAQFKRLGFRKMLIDEAHLYPRKEESMLGQFLKDSGIRQVLGITATPLKMESFKIQRRVEKKNPDGSTKLDRYGNPVMTNAYDGYSELIMLTNLSPSGTFFKRIIHVAQIQEMTSTGYWSPLVYEVLPFDRQALRFNSNGSEYTDDSVVTAYEANNVRENILGALEYHKERKHVLVFVPSVEEAETLASFYPDSAAISGTTPKKQRENIIKAFRAGEIRVIFNVIVLSTGFDYPKIDMIITAYSAASMAKHYQVLGRGIRIDPEKKNCLVVDADGNTERFGRIEDITYEFDGRWRMFGTGGALISGIPVSNIGDAYKSDLYYGFATATQYDTVNFGKHKGRRYDELPITYLSWILGNTAREFNQWTLSRALLAIENRIRDTRGDPPMTEMPDGLHTGESIGFVPKDYLRWYYKQQDWNETNDSLRRGLEIYLFPYGKP